MICGFEGFRRLLAACLAAWAIALSRESGVVAAGVDPVLEEQAGKDGLARLEGWQSLHDVLQRNGEADPRIVEFRADVHAGGVGRNRREHPDHATVDVDERAAVVGR